MKTVVFPSQEVKATTVSDNVGELQRRQTIYDVVEEIKVFADNKNVLSGPGRFKWEISDDLWIMGLDIVQVKIYVTTVGASCTCRITNESQGWDVLTTPLTISAGSYSAKTDRGTLAGIDETKNDLAEDDRFWLNVDSAGGKGLGLIVTYGRDRRP